MPQMQAVSSYTGKGWGSATLSCERSSGRRVVPRLSDIRDKLKSIAGKDVDLSIVKRGDKFDYGPTSLSMTTESTMNDALFCAIHVDSALARDAMASLVAELTHCHCRRRWYVRASSGQSRRFPGLADAA